MTPEELVLAHKQSIHHRTQIEKSSVCGCFYCMKTYAPSAITEWVDDGQTARCPLCGVDSVIGEASGYPIEKSFLKAMKKRWF